MIKVGEEGGGGGGRHPLTAELLFQEVEILDMNTIRDTRTGKYAKQPKVGRLTPPTALHPK